jgi:hypothetical protein
MLLSLGGGLSGCSAEPTLAQDELQTRYSAARISFAEAKPLPIEGVNGPRPLLASILNVQIPMHYGQYVWNEEGAGPGKVWVLVDLGKQTISVFRGKDEIGTAVALYGADRQEKATPLGRFPVLEKRKDHQSNLYDAEMPYMLRLTWDGIAIHGSDVRAGAATNGCVGIPLEFAAKLFQNVEVGTEVLVVRSAGASGQFPQLPTS